MHHGQVQSQEHAIEPTKREFISRDTGFGYQSFSEADAKRKQTAN